ncbi:MAG: erythrose-4-phosphate dehydrogenase [Gammaproteobacteria bacterium]|nr:erythrose-4-phosphate dehydrogenase [Gammaproteobacteria bacterium]MBQ0773040.1 erythrose-4-phosphate dehydrogenase [Gammaproteobacteria bacterium]
MRIALNGYGRIGRSFVRALLEREAEGWRAPFELVAINDLGKADDLLYLTRYDSTHGPLLEPVELLDGILHLGNHSPVLLEHDSPTQCPWRSFNVDVVIECTGSFRAYDDARGHIEAGAGAVILAAVPFDHADDIIVYGVNHEGVEVSGKVLSAASCTTHCIAPLLRQLDDALGVEQVIMKEVHAYTSDQSLLDHVHRDLRRGRAAAQNIVPTTSSAIGAIQKVLPQLAQRISGDSIRVPTINVALVDLTINLRNTVDENALNALFYKAASNSGGLLGYNDEPLVSSDFNHRAESAIYDATQTRVQGSLTHIVAWYDNEWGYANRLLDWMSYLGQQASGLEKVEHSQHEDHTTFTKH